MHEAKLPDPRVWPAASATSGAARLHAAVLEAIDADTRHAADLADAEATELIERIVAAGDGVSLGEAFNAAPSFLVARHLWRLLANVERGDAHGATTLRTTIA